MKFNLVPMLCSATKTPFAKVSCSITLDSVFFLLIRKNSVDGYFTILTEDYCLLIVQKIKLELKEATPDCVIEERFLNSTQLAELFSMTRLNVHPCVYDAYGMTIVEAASQVIILFSTHRQPAFPCASQLGMIWRLVDQCITMT